MTIQTAEVLFSSFMNVIRLSRILNQPSKFWRFIHTRIGRVLNVRFHMWDGHMIPHGPMISMLALAYAFGRLNGRSAIRSLFLVDVLEYFVHLSTSCNQSCGVSLEFEFGATMAINPIARAEIWPRVRHGNMAACETCHAHNTNCGKGRAFFTSDKPSITITSQQGTVPGGFLSKALWSWSQVSPSLFSTLP